MGRRATESLRLSGKQNPLLAGRLATNVFLSLISELFLQPKHPILVDNVDDDWISTAGSVENVAEFCGPALTVKKALGDSRDPEHVHLLITAEESIQETPLEMMHRSKCLISIAYVWINVTLPFPVLRENVEEGRGRMALSRGYSSSSSLSEGESTMIICRGRFVCDVEGRSGAAPPPPPIQISHPVFQEFLDRINDPNFKPDEEVVGQVLRLMPHFSQIHRHKDAAFYRLRELITEVLLGDSSPDGIIFRREQRRSIPLVVFKHKRAFGEKGRDPSSKAAYSLQNLLYEDEVRAFRMFCMSGCDAVPSSTSFATCLVVHLFSLVVSALICPYTAPSS